MRNKIQKMPDCVICADQLLTANKEPAALACGHMFHVDCIRQWFATNPSKKQCPSCKQTSSQAMSKNSGIIRLYVDMTAPSPGGGGAGGEGSSSIDLTDDDKHQHHHGDASGELTLVKHSLLYAQRELQDQKRRVHDIQEQSRGLQDALRVEAEKSRLLRSQLQSAISSARQAQADTRLRESEVERLKVQIASEKEELARARSLQSASDALELEKEVGKPPYRNSD